MSDGDSNSTADWGNVRLGGRPVGGYAANEDPAAIRFAVGLSTLLVIAAIYPWYSYWVHSRLLAMELAAATQALEAEADQASKRIQVQSALMAEGMRARAEPDRLERVSVKGISEQGGLTVAIVELGSARLHEAAPTICQQVRRWRGGGSFGGIEVRRFRGTAPALTVGRIRCDR